MRKQQDIFLFWENKSSRPHHKVRLLLDFGADIDKGTIHKHVL